MSGTNLIIGSIGSDSLPTPGSMARMIYDELAALVPLRVDEDPRGRAVLAIAVATGVINYLKANQGAFVPGGDIGGVALAHPTTHIN